MAHSPTSGSALTLTGLIPNLHHYKGSFGGRVFPLWSDAAATMFNVTVDMLERLETAYGRPVSGEEVVAYVAAVAAHPAYTARFAEDLRQPGLRIPLTADAALFAEAVAIGREVVWLHTFGERWAEGRPPGSPAVEGGGPTQPGPTPCPKPIGSVGPRRPLCPTRWTTIPPRAASGSAAW